MQRSLVLNGFMGCGKSAVGRSLARIADKECVDLDQVIEREAGKSVAQIFKDEGEGAFRARERAALQRLLASETPSVVAVGGGALLERSVRLEVLDKAVVVHLDASIDELWRRVQADGGSRPLAAGASVQDLARLLELRASSYAEAHETVRSEGRSPDAVAAEVLEIWRRDPVCVAAGTGSYSVEVGSQIAVGRVGTALAGASMGLLITDTTVDDLHGAGVREAVARVTRSLKFALTPGEEHKTPETLVELWQFALAAGADRSSRIVGFGGGVVTDVAGLLAATWMRGVSWVSVPTTLLGMVDASVGGKTAVDLPDAKNCVGAFWQPSRVLCDVDYLKTEETRRYSSGLAEVVKTALLGDAELFELLETRPEAVMSRDPVLVAEIVRRCVATKARIVSQDAREGGIRAALNLGHTIGHALEAYGGYGALMHGEAVSLGLVAALRLGERLGLGPASLTQRVIGVLSALGLPTDLSAQPLGEASRLLANDKKRGGNAVRFVFCPEPGRVVFKKLALAELQELMVQLG